MHQAQYIAVKNEADDTMFFFVQSSEGQSPPAGPYGADETQRIDLQVLPRMTTGQDNWPVVGYNGKAVKGSEEIAYSSDGETATYVAQGDADPSRSRYSA